MMEAEAKLKKSIIPEGTSITFADYFKLAADVEDILACFGYSYHAESVNCHAGGRGSQPERGRER